MIRIKKEERLAQLKRKTLVDLVHEHSQFAFSWEVFDREYYHHRFRFPIEVRNSLGPNPTLLKVIRTLPKNQQVRIEIVAHLVLAHEIEEEEIALELQGSHPVQMIEEDHSHTDEHEFTSSHPPRTDGTLIQAFA